jgi:hypothetical protein
MLREVSGKIILAGNLKTKEQKADYLRDILAASGFNPEEINIIVKLEQEGKLTFNEENVDPRSKMRAPDLYLSASLIEQINKAAGMDYPQALVVKYLINSFIKNGETKDAVENDIEDRIRQLKKDFYEGAILWENLKKQLLAKAENKVFDLIKQNDTNWLVLLNELLPTPEVRLLQTLIKEKGLSEKTIEKFIRKYKKEPKQSRRDSFKDFVNHIVEEQIVRPIFNDIYHKTYGAQGQPGIKDKIGRAHV